MIRLTDVSKYYRSNQNVTLGLHKINLESSRGVCRYYRRERKWKIHTAECHQWK